MTQMPIRYLVSRIWDDQSLRFSLSVVGLVVGGLFEGVGVAALVPMLQVVQVGNTPGASGGAIGSMVTMVLSVFGLPFNLATALGFILVVILASEAVNLLQQKVLASSSALFEARMRKKLFGAVLEANWPYFVRTKANDLLSALITDTGQASIAYMTLVQVLGAVIMAVVYLGLSLMLSWQMTLAVVVVSVLVGIFLRHRTNRGTEYGQDVTRINAQLHSQASENLTAAKLVKASASEAQVRERFDVLGDAKRRAQYRIEMNQAWLKALYNSASIVTVFVGIYAAVTVFGMTVAALTVFLFAYYRLAPRLSILQANQSRLLSLIPGLMRVDDYTQTAIALREESGDSALGQFSQAIDLTDVSFAYDADHPVLRHVTLAIPHGESTAIVGPSGAGKTTIMDMIMGLLLPESGEVFVDGTSLRDIRLNDWRRQIGYVPQDASFFHATVAENIAWGLADASREDVIEAAKLADADEFIRRFPEGYDTIIGDRGVRMSGGQRQRLALARAIVRKPSILVLDEATSALDAESEERVQRAVDRLSGSVTTLVVTHRLATVRGCSLIYVLDRGRLIESGSWEELLAHKGQFAELVELQTLASQAQLP